MRNLAQDKRLDRYALDEECEKQADVFHHWACQAADAKKERDLIKSELKELEAKVQIKIRTGKYSLPKDKEGKPIKLSDKTILALVDMDEEVCTLREELIEAEAEYGKAAGAEESMQHRRSSLNNLVELYTKEYYSPIQGGVAPRGAREDIVRDAQNEGLNKKRKSKKEA